VNNNNELKLDLQRYNIFLIKSNNIRKKGEKKIKDTKKPPEYSDGFSLNLRQNH